MPTQQDRQDAPIANAKFNPRCNLLGCEELALASLATYSLCVAHFFSGCRAARETCENLLENRSGQSAALTKQIVVACAKGARGLARRVNVLRHSEQGELLEILLQLESTQHRLRRSMRRMASIPVLLLSDSLDGAWEERTVTLQLSRYGTALKCEHMVQVEQHVSLVRLDTGLETKARVAWNRPGGEHCAIAVEHLSRENFWGCEWGADEAHAQGAPIYLDNTRGQGALNLILTNVEDGDQSQRGARKPAFDSLVPHPKSHRAGASKQAK